MQIKLKWFLILSSYWSYHNNLGSGSCDLDISHATKEQYVHAWEASYYMQNDHSVIEEWPLSVPLKFELERSKTSNQNIEILSCNTIQSYRRRQL